MYCRILPKIGSPLTHMTDIVGKCNCVDKSTTRIIPVIRLFCDGKSAHQKYLASSEIQCWRRMEKISWSDRVVNEGVLHGVEE
jgi:hypothetical protein